MSLSRKVCFLCQYNAACIGAIEAFPVSNTSQIACSGDVGDFSAVCKRGGTHNPISGPNGILVKVTRVIAYMGGAAAIILLIVGSIRLMTSSGDANKAAGARATVINALVGLAIIGLSTAILTFVIEKF